MKQGVLLGIALGSLVIAASAGILSQLGGALRQEAVPSAGVTVAGPVVVRVAAGMIAYRPLGNFSHNGKTVTPALTELPVAEFEIMRFQVSRDDYAVCVAAGACPDAGTGRGQLPQTNVNWHDAWAYAKWLSERTGETWRLPTAPEWQRAAEDRQGDTSPEESDLDPGERMLSQYKRGVLLRGEADTALRPQGGFGSNGLGISDMGGNVWEWTDGCMENGQVGRDGTVLSREPYCGVRIAGGRHRAAIIDFVRDASVGGCAVGLPPDHLGFRLVREVIAGKPPTP